MNKNILITGFFGEGNLGDEAILEAICENLPKNIIPIITSNSKQPYGITIRRRGLLSWPSFLTSAAKSPITIFAGGILQDWSWEGVTFFAYRIIAAAKMGSIPVIYGAGIGPLRTEKAKKLVRKALSFVKIAYVRDKTSYNLYKELLPNADVRLGTDWTWHFQIKEIENNDSNCLAVNLRQWSNKELRENSLLEINKFKGHKIGLSARRGDNELISDVINSNAIQPKTFIEFANHCQKANYGIAMRYHAALAMVRSKLSTKLICYDDKVADLANNIGTTVDKNSISCDFKVPPQDFFINNEYLFQNMKKSFIRLLNEIMI